MKFGFTGMEKNLEIPDFSIGEVEDLEVKPPSCMKLADYNRWFLWYCLACFCFVLVPGKHNVKR
jgi:hypothetical protein